MSVGHVCYSKSDKCVNDYETVYACIWCNACGRVDKKTKWKARVEMYERMLEEQKNFGNWDSDEIGRQRQEEVIEKNVIYFSKELEHSKKMMERYEK